MCHISKDKRAIRSSELIYNSLLECIKKKPFAQITVSERLQEWHERHSIRRLTIFQMCCVIFIPPEQLPFVDKHSYSFRNADSFPAESPQVSRQNQYSFAGRPLHRHGIRCKRL